MINDASVLRSIIEITLVKMKACYCRPRVAKKLSRAWVTVSRPNGSKKFSKAIGTCSVMSYNILSQVRLGVRFTLLW